MYLKSPTQSRNRRWYFALKDGRLYVKPNIERTGVDGSWRPVATPACLDGDIREISADDDELVALDSERSIYTMDQALATPRAVQLDLALGRPVLARAWAPPFRATCAPGPGP